VVAGNSTKAFGCHPAFLFTNIFFEGFRHHTPFCGIHWPAGLGDVFVFLVGNKIGFQTGLARIQTDRSPYDSGQPVHVVALAKIVRNGGEAGVLPLPKLTVRNAGR
jgi:hypothetical protein